MTSRSTTAEICPRLIEVALPIREISAESVRDKSLRHGHISTLHLWWARRPLAACRAIVFASLVPDPDDPLCPKEFRQAVNRLLKQKIPSILQAYWSKKDWTPDRDPYCPYDGIPDTPRNRLLTFIAKWSQKQIVFEKGQEESEPKTGEMIDDRSLVKWETSDPENPQGQEVLKIARELITIAHAGNTPKVLDPFGGGGAIPLEATRLGCQAIANDYNPVAYIILNSTCHYPQRHGKRLVQDVRKWANAAIETVRSTLSEYYPPGKDKLPIVAYVWARTLRCANPSCRAEVPLLGNCVLAKRTGRNILLNIKTKGKLCSFSVETSKSLTNAQPTMLSRGDCRCPVCGQTTPVEMIRKAGLDGKLGQTPVAVITDGKHGKQYRDVEDSDLEAIKRAVQASAALEAPLEKILPEITGKDAEDVSNSTGIRVHLYGMKTWGSLFTPRQLLAMQTFLSTVSDLKAPILKEYGTEYGLAVHVYLSVWLSKLAMFNNTVTRWRSDGEYVDSPFSMQKISMTWDFPEINPTNDSTGGALGQLDWILRVIERESDSASLHPATVLCGDGANMDIMDGSVDAVITDPPYFDAISFADLSDFFYVWHKRSLHDVLPGIFTTPLSPKSNEATALKHRHNGNYSKACRHFSDKLAAALSEARRKCKASGVIAVMFAHQSNEAWTALINALFEADLTVTASYPIDTELKNRARGLDSSALESSITVICRPRQIGAAAASFKDVRKEIEHVVAEAAHRFFDVYGFKGADLIVACYGPAVGVFGKYEKVERADGTPVDVPTLLEFAKEAALKAIAGEFTGDTQSRLYYVWANLYGISEQSWDDARLVVQVGGNSEDAMEIAGQRGIFVVHGTTCRLALLKDRSEKKNLGEDADATLIDQLHGALRLWQAEKRDELVDYLTDRQLTDHAPFWKLAQALFEVLPRDAEDWKLISALLGERETLRTQGKRTRLL